jgi:hypothetical protein
LLLRFVSGQGKSTLGGKGLGLTKFQEAQMSKVNWRRADHKNKQTIRIKDEEERCASDPAAQWLARNGWRRTVIGNKKSLGNVRTNYRNSAH